MRSREIGFLVVLWMLGLGGAEASAQRGQAKRLPSGRSLERLIERFLDADESERRTVVREYDSTYRELKNDYSSKNTRKVVTELVAERQRRIEKNPGTYFFYEEEGRGKYILETPTKKPKALFLGLHGGGVGSGDAGSMASGMGGGEFVWVFPEVLEKTERGWVDAGTDQFVLELAAAASATFDIDPNRVYVSGHSMGGHGTWSLAAHHPDFFAGGAAYAGGPSPVFRSRQNPKVIAVEKGLLPNLYRQRFLFFQSGDDPRVPPEPNDFAAERLAEWKEKYPDGFDYRYVRVEGRGHAAPAEGYLPTQEWVAEHERNPWPRTFLWQPTKEWKRQFYWLVWHRPMLESLLHVQVHDDNRITIDLLEPAKTEPGPITLYLSEELVDLEQPVTVLVNGKEEFHGVVPRRFSTLLMTAELGDIHRLSDARIDL